MYTCETQKSSRSSWMHKVFSILQWLTSDICSQQIQTRFLSKIFSLWSQCWIRERITDSMWKDRAASIKLFSSTWRPRTCLMLNTLAVCVKSMFLWPHASADTSTTSVLSHPQNTFFIHHANTLYHCQRAVGAKLFRAHLYIHICRGYMLECYQCAV